MILRICAETVITRTGGQKNALSHVRKVTALQAWARAGDGRVLVCDGEMVCTNGLEDCVRWPQRDRDVLE